MIHHGYFGYFPGIDFFSLIALAAACALAAYAFFQLKRRKAGDDEALAVLRSRLAKGEINTEEFERLKLALKSEA